MPHFIIECADSILQQQTPDAIMRAVYDAAESTGLFAVNDIKVRIRPYQYYLLGENKKDFLHIFGNIMEGRSTQQKANLSRKIIERLNELLPEIAFLSINIFEFEQATYCNKPMLHPQNIHNDRHFGLQNDTVPEDRP